MKHGLFSNCVITLHMKISTVFDLVDCFYFIIHNDNYTKVIIHYECTSKVYNYHDKLVC